MAQWHNLDYSLFSRIIETSVQSSSYSKLDDLWTCGDSCQSMPHNCLWEKQG